MKTKLILIILIGFTFLCKAQDNDFSQYINDFYIKELPISISPNAETWNIFNHTYDKNLKINMPKSIPDKYVKEFVCFDGFCNPDGGYFRYDYGVKVNLCDNFYTVLIRKLKYEGDSDWNFDLDEILLITYSKSGMILSRKSLTKDNGSRWESSLTITKDKILVKQIKITAAKVSLDKVMTCEVWTTEYQITSGGIIEVKNISPIKKENTRWNKTLLKYEFVN